MRYTKYKKTSAVVRRDEKKMLSAVKVLDGRRAQLLQDRTVKKIVKNTNKCELQFSYSQEKKKIVCTKMKSENLDRKKRGGGDNQS